MCDGACAKKCLIFLNILFFIAGAGVLGIGLWMKIDPMIVNYLHVVNINASDPLIDYAALVFIVVGAAAFVISLIGCCGAMRNSQGLLFVYIVLLLVLIGGEVVGAVLALIYRGEVQETLNESMEAQIKNDYDTGTAPFDAWNYLQVKLECCGANNYTDFKDSYWWNNTRTITNGTQEYVPMQCCKLSGGDYLNPHVADFHKCQEDARDHFHESEVLNTKGCHNELQDWFQQHSLIMMVIGFAVGAVQLLGVICACNLRKSLRTGKYTA